MKNNGLTPPPGEFERFMSSLICQSVEKSMQQYMGRVPPNLLTIEETANILKVDENTVRRYCRNGDLKFNQVGKFIRIDIRHLNEYLAKNEM